jgi:hypothetical protein
LALEKLEEGHGKKQIEGRLRVERRKKGWEKKSV